jgi:hypothetical protein
MQFDLLPVMKEKVYQYNCALCHSPYREEIEKQWTSKKVPRTVIFNSYISKLPIKPSFGNFYGMVRRHIKEKHGASNITMIQFQKDSVVVQPGVTIESFAQKLLEMGSIKVQQMNPDEVALKDVIAAQKLLIEKQKVKLTEDQMMLQMAKLFGPQVPEPIEGETVDGNPRPLES